MEFTDEQRAIRDLTRSLVRDVIGPGAASDPLDPFTRW